MSERNKDSFLGVDGGGSRTRAVLIDSEMRPIGKGISHGSNPNNIGFADAANRIDQAVEKAIENAGSHFKHLSSAFLGIAGLRYEKERTQLSKELEQYQWTRSVSLKLDHDLAIAYYAALGDKAGICLVAGTGSSCFGKDSQGKQARTSGRSLGDRDPGSGYAIGKDALDSLLFSTDDSNRGEIAKLAADLITLGESGNQVAKDILNSNAASLVDLVQRTKINLSLGDSFEIALSGGLATADTIYRKIVMQQLNERFPKAQLSVSIKDPALAAACLAMSRSAPSTKK